LKGGYFADLVRMRDPQNTRWTVRRSADNPSLPVNSSHGQVVTQSSRHNAVIHDGQVGSTRHTILGDLSVTDAIHTAGRVYRFSGTCTRPAVCVRIGGYTHGR